MVLDNAMKMCRLHYEWQVNKAKSDIKIMIINIFTVIKRIHCEGRNVQYVLIGNNNNVISIKECFVCEKKVANHA